MRAIIVGYSGSNKGSRIPGCSSQETPFFCKIFSGRHSCKNFGIIVIFFSFAQKGGESEICVVQSISVGESSFFLLYIVLAASSFRCPKSFWDLPLSECTLWPVNPKTWQKVVVLGFASSRRLSRAHQSQTILNKGSGTIRRKWCVRFDYRNKRKTLLTLQHRYKDGNRESRNGNTQIANGRHPEADGNLFHCPTIYG